MSRPGDRRGDAMNAVFGSTRLPVSAAVATLLSTLCLGGTFLTGAWFFPAVFAALFTIAGCEAARRLSAPRSFVPLVGLAVLLCYLVSRYARDEAYYWFVPNREALTQLGDLAQSGRTDISRFAAPIAVSPGIELLVTGGVGLVALAVDTLAVTMRRAALAGLPLLALYTVPTTVAPNGVGWVAFALGGIGYLTLLLAEARERVSRWGRPMRYTAPRPNWRPDVETAPLAQVGRRVGAAALGLALVVPAVLPQLDASSFGFGGSGFGRGRGGGNEVKVINPILKLGENLRQGTNQPVIRYTGKATYVRLVGLDVFGGDKWSPSSFRVSNKRNDVTEGFSRPPGWSAGIKAVPHKYSFKVFDLEATWLPLPYAPVRVSDIDGRWVYDQASFNVIPTNGSTRQISYKARTLSIEPTAEQLRAAGASPASVSRYLQLPRDMPQVVGQTARAWVAGASTRFDQAVAIQNHLRSNAFHYSTEVQDTLGDANGVQAIARFLDQREGYCVHFASAMAVMARTLGIPARVAVGFTAGRLLKDGSHLISSHDAHAWPELYFSGVGWVAFEPTPAGDRTPAPGFSIAANDPQGPGSHGGISNPRGSDRPDAATSQGIPKQVPSLDTPGAGAAAAKAKPAKPLPVLPIAAGVGLVVLALLPLMARSWIRRRRWRRATGPAGLATATWAELQDTLLDYGYDWPASDPPRTGAVRLADERGLTGEVREALRRLASATERSRYAPELGAVGDLRADVETVRTALRQEAGLWGRARARFLPRSARSVLTAISEHFADLLDMVDTLGARLRPRRAG